MKFKTLFGLILISFAAMLLLDVFGAYHWTWLFDQPWTGYVAPFAALCLGISMLSDGVSGDRDRWLSRPVPQGEDGKRAVMEVSFGGDEYIWHGEPFHGARMEVTFGGLKVDLRGARITEDEEIDIHTFCGGVELFVPADVNIVVQSRSRMGGVDNGTRNNPVAEAPTIHISASTFLGGVSIRN